MKEWVPRVISDDEMDSIFKEAGIFDLWINDSRKQESNPQNKMSNTNKNIQNSSNSQENKTLPPEK